MRICLRYSKNEEEALEVMNDGFFKIFTKIETYDPDRPFPVWLRRVMVNTALDRYRQEVKFHEMDGGALTDTFASDETISSGMAYDEILSFIHQLTPAYRMVFCLAVIDGYSHEEIAGKLGISVGASKSNLARAREKLRAMLSKLSADEYARMAR